MSMGPLKRICHWGPLTALSIIKSISFMTMYCGNMWWPPKDYIGGSISSVIFLIFSGLTLYNFMSAIYEGPGYLPFKWHPAVKEDVACLQFCDVCQGYKAPRSHHCRKCGRCVMKMDHHCPWINNCVGHNNHGHFTAFLFWAVCGCSQASVVLGCTLYRALNRTWYMYYCRQDPLVTLTVTSLVFCVFCLGLAIGVVCAVGMLLFFQMRAIVRNQTAIEDWIVEKANHRRRYTGEPRFVYPYDLGRWANLRQVLSLTCTPAGDGVQWAVGEGCNQYTLTLEQQRQKCDKRQRTRSYQVVRRFSGYWFPLVHGVCVLVHPPFTDEQRIHISPGDTILVTRWRRYWLFGEKVSTPSEPEARRLRGWFPRCCAVETLDATKQHEEEQLKDK